MSQLEHPPEQHEKAAKLPQSEQHGDTLPSSSGPSIAIVKQSERRVLSIINSPNSFKDLLGAVCPWRWCVHELCEGIRLFPQL